MQDLPKKTQDQLYELQLTYLYLRVTVTLTGANHQTPREGTTDHLPEDASAPAVDVQHRRGCV